MALLAINWILTAFSNELIFLAYGQYVPFLWVLTISAVSVMIGGLSQIPGGIGAREITSVVLFVFLGVPQDLALISVVLLRIFTIVPMAIGYVFLLDFEKHFHYKFF